MVLQHLDVPEPPCTLAEENTAFQYCDNRSEYIIICMHVCSSQSSAHTDCLLKTLMCLLIIDLWAFAIYNNYAYSFITMIIKLSSMDRCMCMGRSMTGVHELT